ncbi:MAG: hypothetical protein ACI9CE_002664 [Flavobacterium sp.]|jgi:hypothetical protein
MEGRWKMDLIDRSIVFNSTILVLWAVMFVPYVLQSKRFWMLGFSGLIIIPIEIYLSWELREYPFNIIVGFFMFFFALGGGFLMHYSNKREKRKLE